jgi:hypothetical protein
LLALLLPFEGKAEPSPTDLDDDFFWLYAEFVQAFRQQDWPRVCEFVTDATQTGFGPGESGCEGVLAVFAKDQACWEEMVFALRQGCRLKLEGRECISPPQFEDESVVYLGARASFSYDKHGQLMMARWLVCAGD